MPPKTKYKSKFQKKWLGDVRYMGWLKEGEDQHSANCNLCKVDFSVAGQGEGQVKSHMNSATHKLKTPPAADSNQTTVTPQPVVVVDEVAVPQQQQTITGSLLKENVTKAEIMWALETVLCHYSYRSAESKKKLFAGMFPDSEIARSLAFGKTKINYMVTHGLAPYFKELLLSALNSCPWYALSFDESYNPVAKKSQMDLIVRYWDVSRNRVMTRYFTSEFLGKASAKDVFQKFEKCCESLDKDKIIQVSSDGPNVNLLFHNILDESRADLALKVLTFIGTCGLHTIHRSLEHGVTGSDWDIKKILSSLYKIFDESPSRRADYEKINCVTEEEYPKKFCAHRWVENELVAARALVVWPKVVEVVIFWLTLPKSKQPGKGDLEKHKSYGTLVRYHKNLMVPLMFMFFQEVAEKLNSFLRRFQTDSPMVPFLADAIEGLVRGFCSKFILDEVMDKKAKKTVDLVKLDVTDKNLQKRDMEFGYKLKHEIKLVKPKVTDTQIKEFERNAVKFLATMCHHTLQNSPLKIPFVRWCRCFNPMCMSDNPDACRKLLDLVLEKLVKQKRLTSSFADDAKKEYKDFLKVVVKPNKRLFMDFDMDKERLDDFFMKFLDGVNRFSKIAEVVKFVLTLSHGQAAVERGFSISEKTLFENLGNDNLIAKRIVIDHMLTHDLKAYDLPITRELSSVRSAHSKYAADLEKKKAAEKKAAKEGHSEEIGKQIEEMNKKTSLLQATIKDMLATSENLQFRAEDEGKLALLGTANGLKRCAKEKQEELDECLKEKKRLVERRENLK